MSLKYLQQSWLELLSHAAQREAFQRGELSGPIDGLEAHEMQSLRQIDPEWLASMAKAHTESVTQHLLNAFPESIFNLIGPVHAQAVVNALLIREPSIPCFEPRALVSLLLNELLHALTTAELMIPHLRDLVHYELAAAQLCFFRLPEDRQVPLAGPLLADWVRIVRLGKYFPLFLRQGSAVPFSETPREEFLLLRDFQGLKLELLNPLTAACLQRCQGNESWESILSRVAGQTDESHLTQSLMYYVQRGLVLLPHTESLKRF